MTIKLGDRINLELEVHEIITKKNKDTYVGLCLPNAGYTQNIIYIPESMFEKGGEATITPEAHIKNI